MTASEPRTNGTAVAAALAAALGFCFWGIGGVVALALGLAARAQIARSEGRESGAGLATVAIVLGGVNIAACVLAVTIAVTLALRPSAPASRARALPAPPLAASAAPAPSAGSRAAARQSEPRETVVGKVRVVDLGSDSVSLRRTLENQKRLAEAEHERLLVYVVAPNCLPCNGFMLGLPDARLQAALAGVRLVRVDAAVFGAELVALGIPIEALPGFALLGESLRPRDYVHGGEWDADIPENIAPVLDAFLRGKYATRRHRFHNPRPDQTAL